MTKKTTAPMTPEEIEAYRAAVTALIEDCLKRVRSYPVERSADPVRERRRP